MIATAGVLVLLLLYLDVFLTGSHFVPRPVRTNANGEETKRALRRLLRYVRYSPDA